jgi:GNAT superfamily N-acetyltransferase
MEVREVSTPDPDAISAALEVIAAEAAEAGVGLDMWLMGDPRHGDFIWISEFNRERGTRPGDGKIWLDRVLALGQENGVEVRLCCTSWNTGLVRYYERAGFVPLYEEGEEVHLGKEPSPTCEEEVDVHLGKAPVL